MANFSRDSLRSALEGPVFPILTPFTADGSAVDHAALERYVRFLVGAGAPAIMTTVGTSRFNLLSEDEIRAVNATVAGAGGPGTITVCAGTMVGDTASNVAAAQHAQAAGADAYIAFLPERYYGDQPIVDFFRAISESVDIGVMIHEMPMRSGYGGQVQYSLDLLERLVDLPGVVGMKEECMDGGYAYLLHRRLAGKCGIIGAGSMRNFMRDFHAGARAYLVGVGSFFPKVAMAFHRAFTTNDVERAHAIVRAYEDPYFDVAVQLGWHVQLKEMLSLLDLMPPHERAPLPRLNAEQQAKLRALVDQLGWTGRAPDHAPDDHMPG